jgi:putative toxin-antitoxin system antitoxin component (TIGR02293 family)
MPTDLRRRIESGLPYATFIRLQQALALPLPAVAVVVQLPIRTLARRKAAGRLAPDESERVVRIAGVLAKAQNLFEGDRAAALAWLAAPNRALGDERPLDVARTEVGAREVEDLIGRLEHGVFS